LFRQLFRHCINFSSKCAALLTQQLDTADLDGWHRVDSCGERELALGQCIGMQATALCNPNSAPLLDKIFGGQLVTLMQLVALDKG